MRVLDLFSGIGGFSLGLERAGMETVAFCDFDEPAQQVLKKNWPEVPIYNDVSEVTSGRLESDGIIGINVITAGFPCQPYSRANWKIRQGREDVRDCTAETIRVVSDFNPAVFIGENTEGFIDIGLAPFLDDLEEIGYYAEALSVPACAFGLPTLERHIWIIATPLRERSQRYVEKTISNITALQGKFPRGHTRIGKRWHTAESRVCRSGEGVSNRLDRNRVKQVGNAVDPRAPEIIGRSIMEEQNE